ncbi:MAG: hypothetical protein IJ683_05315 [Butyrivibrio sp.]|nr:hypothetical protein [Butyrivibrio sp.]MBR1641727.1 hypothetical protein [Butyrivibrio sp.]
MIEELLKDITLDYLKDTEIGTNILKAMQGIQKAQEVAMAYVNDDSPDHLKMMRVGTIAAFSIISKVAAGKSIKDFDNQDWKDVASKVAEYAILTDGQLYSVRIFEAYAGYVDISVKVLELNGISEEKRDAISTIAKKVRGLSKELANGKLTEVQYTEQCLWLLLEAMIKLISSYSAVIVGEELAEFSQSVAMLAFEYGRYTLYKQELDILNQYLEHQEAVDNELEDKLKTFKDMLQERSKVFDDLVADAFSPDIEKRLMTSVELAKNAGVDEAEILDSIDKVDDFFS